MSPPPLSLTGLQYGENKKIFLLQISLLELLLSSQLQYLAPMQATMCNRAPSTGQRTLVTTLQDGLFKPLQISAHLLAGPFNSGLLHSGLLQIPNLTQFITVKLLPLQVQQLLLHLLTLPVPPHSLVQNPLKLKVLPLIQ